MVKFYNKTLLDQDKDLVLNNADLFLFALTFEEFKNSNGKLMDWDKILSECDDNSPRFESHEDYEFLSLYYLDVKNIINEQARICIYFTCKQLVFITDNEKVLKSIEINYNNQDSKNLSLEKALWAFFDTLTNKDTLELENIEQQITDMEESLITSDRKDCISEIVRMRKTLLSLKRYYEQLIDILELLQENQNEMISKKELRYFKMQTNRVNRLLDNVTHLRDYVTQVREAYQAQVDIDANNIMKVFTVITSVFLPLTLIAGWYGMNLKMPEYNSPIAYPIVILSSFIVIILCLVLYKKNKWF